MPKELQGTLGLTYAGFSEHGNLVEDEVVVGKRRVLRHDLDWKLEFAPLNGFAAVIGLSQTPVLQYSYPESRSMLYEPVNGGGTYLLDDQTQDATVRGSGLNGVWFGAAFSPFNERYDRGQKSTWRLDIAMRTGSQNKNLWVARDGSRGSAPGGTALKFAGAVSQDLGVGNPWAHTQYIKENGFTADLVDENGNTWAKKVDLQPASELEVRAGVAVMAFEEPAQQTEFAMDLWLGFGYRTWEDVSSGVYLPSVLDGGKQIAMTTGDYTYAMAGINADYQINEYVRARTGPDFRFHTPFTPEHAYEVVTGPRHIGIGWMFRIEGMLQANTPDAIETVEESVPLD